MQKKLKELRRELLMINERDIFFQTKYKFERFAKVIEKMDLLGFDVSEVSFGCYLQDWDDENFDRYCYRNKTEFIIRSLKVWANILSDLLKQLSEAID